MALVSLGDMAQSFMLRRQNLALKADLQTLATEMTTGRTSDIARQTHGDISPLASIDASLSRLGAYGAATSELGLFTGSMQTALGTIDSLAGDIGVSLLRVADPGQETAVASLALDARQKFETVVSVLNTRVGDRTLFAGQATDGSAVAAPDTMLAALETAITGAVSAADIETAISNWFDDPLGYAATAYLGAVGLEPVPIAPGETAQVGITAMDPAIKKTLKGLAMAAVLDRGALAGAPLERAHLARRAGESLISGQTGRAYLAAGLGVVEGKIDSAQSRNSAEASTLQIARSGIVSVDPYETAARLESTQTQLETLYTITARMTRLSLMDFLR